MLTMTKTGHLVHIISTQSALHVVDHNWVSSSHTIKTSPSKNGSYHMAHSPWSISLFGISHSSQVWTGPTDVWKVEVSEESRVLHRRRLDDGVVTPLAQTSNTWGEMVVMWSQRSLFFLMFCSVKGASLWVFLKWSVGQGQFHWWHQVWWDCQRLFDLFFLYFINYNKYYSYFHFSHLIWWYWRYWYRLGLDLKTDLLIDYLDRL